MALKQIRNFNSKWNIDIQVVVANPVFVRQFEGDKRAFKIGRCVIYIPLGCHINDTQTNSDIGLKELMIG
jgi:hypothetical protein